MKRLNNVGMSSVSLIVTCVVFLVLVVGSIYWFGVKAETFNNGEEKADSVMKLLSETPGTTTDSDSLIALSEEVEKYGGMHETIDDDELKIYKGNVRSQISTYHPLIYEGTYEKQSSSAATNDLQVTTTTYRLTTNNDENSLFAGSQLVSIVTAFIDDNWRVVNFKVEKAV